MLKPLPLTKRSLLLSRYFYSWLFYVFFLLSNTTLLANSSFAYETQSIKINSDLEIDFNFQAPTKNSGNTLLLVMPSEHGLQVADQTLLENLPNYGIEVWLSNLLESYFLPYSASNLERIPADHIQQIVKKIHDKTHKNIIILTAGRGAIPVLRALASWPDNLSPAYLTGLILMHPKLLTKTPEPGLAAEVMPSVKNTNQLIYLIQPTQSPFWWNRKLTLDGLEQSGSDVFTHPLKNVRNRYYFRPDATPDEQRLTGKYLNLIYSAMTQLMRYPAKARVVVKDVQTDTQATSDKTHRSLAKYKGSPIPPTKLSLDILAKENQSYNIQDDKGKVLLVNFWASWCPPCVHEMPSMQALDNLLNKNTKNVFKILAVNMGEDKKTITTFLKEKVSVNFDILLDTDGAALKHWKIFAFPTSFIIDKQGNIRYAIYGGIDWLEPDIVTKIQKLINE